MQCQHLNSNGFCEIKKSHNPPKSYCMSRCDSFKKAKEASKEDTKEDASRFKIPIPKTCGDLNSFDKNWYLFLNHPDYKYNWVNRRFCNNQCEWRQK